MEYTITRQMNRNAVEASADAAAAQIAREGIGQFERTAEEQARVDAIRQHLDAQYADADLAQSLLSKMTNRSDEAAFVDLLSREHAYLLDKIAWTVLKAVATRIADSDGYVDGRISPTLADFVKANVAPLRRDR